MKGIGIKQFGDIHQLCEVEMATPPIGSGEVLVQVKASGVQVSDWQLRSGQLFGEDSLPMILGRSGAGIIQALGSKELPFKSGDKVFFQKAITKYGAYANEVVLPIAELCLMPGNLTFIEAAALPENSLPAWQAVLEGEVKEGTVVLVLGNQTNIGMMLIQMLKALGAIICIVNNESMKRQWINVAVDSVKRHSEQQLDFDLLIDTIGQANIYLGAVKWMRMGADVIKFTNPNSKVNVQSSTYEKEKRLRIKNITAKNNQAHLKQIKQLVEDGKLRPVLAQVYSLSIEGIQKAHFHKQTGFYEGEIVVCHRS